MKLINPSVEIIEQKPGMKGLYEQIELAARNCYKSEGLIKYDEEGNSTTAKEFVDKVVNIYKHQSVAEHGTVYLFFKENCYNRQDQKFITKYERNPYSKVICIGLDDNIHEDGTYHDIMGGDALGYTQYAITTNYRVLLENNWLDDLKYMCEPTEYHEKRITVRFICDIGISREANRHRANSPSEESTRYCNFSREKFGKQISIIQNDDISAEEYNNCILKWARGDVKSPKSAFRTMCGEIYNFKEDQFSIVDVWLFTNCACEFGYMELLKRGWTPQQARRVLPFDLKSDLIHTAFVSDWKHFFSLRDNELAHPDMIVLAKPLHEEFIKRGYLNE